MKTLNFCFLCHLYFYISHCIDSIPIVCVMSCHDIDVHCEQFYAEYTCTCMSALVTITYHWTILYSLRACCYVTIHSVSGNLHNFKYFSLVFFTFLVSKKEKIFNLWAILCLIYDSSHDETGNYLITELFIFTPCLLLRHHSLRA